MTDDDGPRTLDLLGLNCPLPVLKTRRALARLAPGERLVVLASDPLAAVDLPHLCAEDGHRLVSLTRQGVEIRVEIERGPGPSASRGAT
jgi:tRNA 2-thiouridine synthesizing protein A